MGQVRDPGQTSHRYYTSPGTYRGAGALNALPGPPRIPRRSGHQQSDIASITSRLAAKLRT